MSKKFKQALRTFNNVRPTTGQGVYLSKKAKDVVPYANMMELVFMYWLDHNPQIVSFQYENLEIPYVFDGELHIYRPDFDVVTNHFRAIWELKETPKTGGSKTTAKARAATEYAKEHGYGEYRVITTNDIGNIFDF